MKKYLFLFLMLSPFYLKGQVKDNNSIGRIVAECIIYYDNVLREKENAIRIEKGKNTIELFTPYISGIGLPCGFEDLNFLKSKGYKVVYQGYKTGKKTRKSSSYRVNLSFDEERFIVKVLVDSPAKKERGKYNLVVFRVGTFQYSYNKEENKWKLESFTDKV